MAFVDIESMVTEIKDKIKTDLNAKLVKIDTLKADTITLKKLQTGTTIGDDIDYLDANGKAEGYDPFIVLDPSKKDAIEGIGGGDIEINIWLSLKDPGDYTGKRRMMRYLLALERLFGDGTKILNMPIATSGLLGWVAETDFRDEQVTLLTWGLGLSFRIG